MKDVAQPEARQIRIFPSDKVPLLRLAAPAVSEMVAKRLGGAEVVSRPPAGSPIAGELVFSGGTLPAEGKTGSNIIKVLQIAERKIALVVEGTTAVANRAYELFSGVAKELGYDLGEPLVLTHETSCVVTLDFDWTALLAPPTLSFVQGPMLASLAGPTAPAIRGLSFAIRLGYPDVPSELREHGVSLADKAVTIEPRAQTPLSERRYFTSSPSDTETHMALLRELEGALAPPKKAIGAPEKSRAAQSPPSPKATARRRAR